MGSGQWAVGSGEGGGRGGRQCAIWMRPRWGGVGWGDGSGAVVFANVVDSRHEAACGTDWDQDHVLAWVGVGAVITVGVAWGQAVMYQRSESRRISGSCASFKIHPSERTGVAWPIRLPPNRPRKRQSNIRTEWIGSRECDSTCGPGLASSAGSETA